MSFAKTLENCTSVSPQDTCHTSWKKLSPANSRKLLRNCSSGYQHSDLKNIRTLGKRKSLTYCFSQVSTASITLIKSKNSKKPPQQMFKECPLSRSWHSFLVKLLSSEMSSQEKFTSNSNPSHQSVLLFSDLTEANLPAESITKCTHSILKEL